MYKFIRSFFYPARKNSNKTARKVLLGVILLSLVVTRMGFSPSIVIVASAHEAGGANSISHDGSDAGQGHSDDSGHQTEGNNGSDKSGSHNNDGSNGQDSHSTDNLGDHSDTGSHTGDQNQGGHDSENKDNGSHDGSNGQDSHGQNNDGNGGSHDSSDSHGNNGNDGDCDYDDADCQGGGGGGNPPPTIPNADASITKTVDNTAPVEGGTIHYTVTVSAMGPATSTGVTATDVLPSGITFVDATSAIGSYASSTGIWTIGDMQASSTANLVITATVNQGTAGTTITNSAAVNETAAVNDPNSGNNTSTAPITVAANGCTSNCGGGTPATSTLAIDPTTLPDGIVGAGYAQTLTATGTTIGSFHWTMASGTLPTGFTLDASSTNATTSIAGTPTAAGTYQFAISVVNGSSSATQSYTVNIAQATGTCTTNCGGGNPATSTLSIDPATLPDGITSSSYDQTLTAIGNASGTYSWSVATGTLPDGLSLDTAQTGATTTISGTPTAVGTFTFTISVVNGSSSATQAYTVNVTAPTVGCAPNCGGGGGGTPTSSCAPNCGGGGGGLYYSYDLKINNGDSQTATTTVILDFITTAGAAGVVISNDANFSTSTTDVYSPTRPWVLTSGNGTKTVYVKYLGSTGYVLATVQAHIDLVGTQIATEPPVTTGQVLGASCSLYMTSYVKYGSNNDPDQVRKLQTFLNENLGLRLAVTGVYDQNTKKAVETFQVKYGSQVLRPWVPHGLASETTPTGYVFKTTLRWINILHCPTLDLQMPILP